MKWNRTKEYTSITPMPTQSWILTRKKSAISLSLRISVKNAADLKMKEAQNQLCWIKTTFRPISMCEERSFQLFVIPGKKAKRITSCGHIESKDQGHTAWLPSKSNRSFVLCINQYLTKIVRIFAYQLSILLCNICPIFEVSKLYH